MLKFQIRHQVSAVENLWQLTTSGVWTNGDSWIEPFANPALEHSLFADDGVITVVVRERLRGHPLETWPQYLPCGQRVTEHAVTQTREWPGDFLLLQIGHDGISIESGHWGTAPLYLSSDGPTLFGSWDITDLRQHCIPALLDDQQVVDFLTLRSRYSVQTLFRGVQRLTERARACWAPSQPVNICLPEPGVHYLPRELHPDAPVLDAYGSLLREAVALRALNADEVVVELSGGTDSATIALATRTALQTGAAASYGLLVGGDAATQQIRRRAVLGEIAGMPDVTVDAHEHAPLAPPQPGVILGPGEEPYRAAVSAALEAVTRPVVLTGIGGDELFALRPDERPLLARGRDLPEFLTPSARETALQGAADPYPMPVTLIPETALQASLVRAPIFLRAGRWPVSPLCSPDLVRFGEWLPRAWREGKRLPREWLLSHGVPRDVVWPRLRENFVPVMQHGLRRHGLEQLRRMTVEDSILIDLGYVDPDTLRALAATAQAAEAAAQPIDDRLYHVLALEQSFRTLFA